MLEKYMPIYIKSKKEINIMREGGRILATVLERLKKEVRPGMTTEKLERLACDLITQAGGRPAFKGYQPSLSAAAFPTALCLSVNSEVVHAPALPSRELKEGDIVGIDIGMEYPIMANGQPVRGMYTDMAATMPVGRVSRQVEKLISVTEQALELAIAVAQPGKKLSDIGRAIQDYVEDNGFSVVRDLVGHGVGRKVHEDPQVPNFYIRSKNFKDLVLRSGLTIAIEPMVNIGKSDIMTGHDGFSIVTVDGSLSAHFEHTIAILEDGNEVLTALST